MNLTLGVGTETRGIKFTAQGQAMSQFPREKLYPVLLLSVCYDRLPGWWGQVAAVSDLCHT